MTDTKLPLLDFQRWLIDDRHLAATTTGGYIAILRAFLRDPVNAKALTADAEKLSEEALLFDATHLRPNSKRVFRAAIRAFARFLEIRTGLDFSSERLFRFPDGRRKEKPDPHGRMEEEPLAPDPLSPLLGPLLRKLEKARIPWNHVPLIRWRDVRGGIEFAFVEDKLAEVTYQIPIGVIREIGLWAGKGEKPALDLPLIPHEPGSFSPMSKSRLIRIVRGP